MIIRTFRGFLDINDNLVINWDEVKKEDAHLVRLVQHFYSLFSIMSYFTITTYIPPVPPDGMEFPPRVTCPAE